MEGVGVEVYVMVCRLEDEGSLGGFAAEREQGPREPNKQVVIQRAYGAVDLKGGRALEHRREIAKCEQDPRVDCPRQPGGWRAPADGWVGCALGERQPEDGGKEVHGGVDGVGRCRQTPKNPSSPRIRTYHLVHNFIWFLVIDTSYDPT